MSNFTKQLEFLGELAAEAITKFMAGKQEWWVEGYQPYTQDHADDVEIDDNWPTFDTLGGDINSLVGIEKLHGVIKIHAILRMDHLPEEFAEYGLGDLSAQALCSIADDLSRLEPTPAEKCLRNILNAHACIDSASMAMYLKDAKKLFGDPV